MCSVPPHVNILAQFHLLCDHTSPMGYTRTGNPLFGLGSRSLGHIPDASEGLVVCSKAGVFQRFRRLREPAAWV